MTNFPSADTQAVVSAYEALTTQVRRLADALTTPVVDVAEGQLTTVANRVPCPYCIAPTMIASTLITDHIARLHNVGLATYGPYPTADEDAPVDALAIAADLRTENQALRERVAGLADGLRYLLAYRGPQHAHEQPGVWDTSGRPCVHCGRLAAIHADLAAVSRLQPSTELADNPSGDAANVDEDVVRAERLTSLGVLLSRILNGLTLTADEGKLLIEHIDAETRESSTARAVAAGNKRHVRVLFADLQEALKRAAQAEAERDGAYRERAHLIALLAAVASNAVLAPAPDVDEPGWTIVYLKIGGSQASWHISPRDADLFAHVEAVEANDPRAQWDGHTTDEKYERIARYTAKVAGMGGTPFAQAQAVIERVRDLADRWDRDAPPPGNRPLTDLRSALAGTEQPTSELPRECLFARDGGRPCPTFDRCATCDQHPASATTHRDTENDHS